MDYLDGVLEGPALAAFEAKLEEDSHLRAEAEKLKKVRDAVKRYGLRQKVSTIRAEMRSDERAVPSAKLRVIRGGRWWVAAAVLLVVAVGLYQYYSITAGGLYEQMYQPYAAPATRGQGTANEIEKAYREKEYELVLAEVDHLSSPGVQDYFYAGNAALQLDNYGKAIVDFEKILEIDRRNGSHTFEEAAEYYLAVSYLAAGRVRDALPLFERIHSNPRHSYHDNVGRWRLQQLRWLRSRQ